MSVLEIILVAFALAMDCFTVSIVNGISAKGIDRRLMARSCVLFGVFQCMMALIGWGVAFSFAGYIKSVDHWIAFVILLLLGGKMIYDSLKHDDGECRAAGPGSPAESPLRMRTTRFSGWWPRRVGRKAGRSTVTVGVPLPFRC